MNNTALKSLGLLAGLALLTFTPALGEDFGRAREQERRELLAELVAMNNRQAVITAELYRLAVVIHQTNQDIASVHQQMEQTPFKRRWHALQYELRMLFNYLSDVTANRDDLIDELIELHEHIVDAEVRLAELENEGDDVTPDGQPSRR